MNTSNVTEMMVKLHEFNKKGLLSDYDYANLSKALVNENLTDEEIKQKELEFKREQEILKTREHSEELRREVNRRKINAEYDKRMKKEILYLSILLNRFGERAYSIETLVDIPYYEIDFLASEIRRLNHNPSFRLLNEEEQQKYINLVLDEDERKDFKFDYTFPAPSWMKEEIKNKKSGNTNKPNSEEIEAKKKEIADKLYAESKKKDKERRQGAKAKTENKDRTQDINNMASFGNTTTKKNRENDINNLANFDNTTKNKKDRTQDINNMANYDNKQENKAEVNTENKVEAKTETKVETTGVELTPKQRFVKSVKNIGDKFKEHPYMIAAGAFVIASLTVLISPTVFAATLAAGTAGTYFGKKIYAARVRK